MKPALRQSMASLHTWVGLLPGWLCYLIFLFGSTAYFQQEISRWMRPEISGTLTPVAIDAADAMLRRQGAGAHEWHLSLPARGGQVVRVSWSGPGGSQTRSLDPATGREIAVRDTRGGSFLYTFHYELYGLPRQWARLIVCLAALAMLVAILSGVVTHKKIFTDFFTLRLHKGQRSWLDAHNVTAVLALPFHLMITYTGLVALWFSIMPWPIHAHFPDRAAFNRATYPAMAEIAPAGRPAPVLPLRRLIERAEALWDGGHVGGLSISNPGDAQATVSLYAQRDRLGVPAARLLLNAADGRLLQRETPGGGARNTQDIMVLLHLGTYADSVLRWCYCLSGLAGTVMVGSGLTLWIVKRSARLPDPTRPSAGFRIVERLNLAVIAGAPLGIAVYFLANRLLPIAMAHRAEGEVDSLFIAWGAALVWSIARPVRRAWIEVLGACAAAFALVPLANALTTPRGLLPSLIAGDRLFVAFDLTMLAMACLFALTARHLAHRSALPPPRRPIGRAHA